MAEAQAALYDALNVLIKDPAIRPHIDPMALAQAEAAIALAEEPACDHCNGFMTDTPQDDWNPETGNHYACENYRPVPFPS